VFSGKIKRGGKKAEYALCPKCTNQFLDEINEYGR